MKIKYKIIVNLPSVTLTFKVENYEIIDGSFYRFYDYKTGMYRIYDTRICDLMEVEDE